MTRPTQWIARTFTSSLLAFVIGCQSTLPSASSAHSEDRAIPAAYISGSDAARTLSAIDVARKAVAFNLRNKDTTAFKASVVRIQIAGNVTCRLDMSQGRVAKTANPLDVAIQGQGFFKVKILASINGGIGCTRNGNFVVNKDGSLVLNVGDGYKLMPPVCIPTNSTSVTIGSDGSVSVLQPGQATPIPVGQIKLSVIPNPEGLALQGGSLYTETAASGQSIDVNPGAKGTGQLLQGFLEASNVDAAREKARLRFLDDWHHRLAQAVGIDDGGPSTDFGERK